MPTLLTIDHERFDADRIFRTADGYTVRVTSKEDIESTSSCPGDRMLDIDEICPGLVDAFDEEFPGDLPTHRRYAYTSMGYAKASLATHVAHLLLSGRQKSRAPRRVIARMCTIWEEIHSRAEHHARALLDGLESVTVRVSKNNKTLAIRTLDGVNPEDGHYLVDQLIANTIEEAKDNEHI